MPTWQDGSFGAHYEAARQVGGDFYDVFAIPGGSGKYGIVIADVADKGVPCGARLWRPAAPDSRHRGGWEHARRCARKSRIAYLLEDNDSSLFVTAIFARLDPDRATWFSRNGGICGPCASRREGRVEEVSLQGHRAGCDRGD